jgi:hypothetical protein
MKKILFFFSLISFGIFSNVDIKITDNNKVLLENEFFILLVDPDFGAQGIKLIDKKTKKQLIPDDGKIGGIFSDHDFRQYWPGEFFSSKYNYEIIEKNENKGVVEFSYNVKGEWRGKSFPSLKGLLIKKRYIIFSEKPYIDVEVRIQNPTDEGKDIIYWVQNFISGNGNTENDLYYRPSKNGIIVEKGKSGGIEWIYEPVSGWTGVLDKEANNGVIFLMDYNYLDTLYNCLSSHTTEWIYDYISIPSKKEWITNIRLVLTKGFNNYSYASKNIIFGVGINEKENKLNFEYQIQSSEKEIKECKIKTIYKDMGEKPKLIYDTTQAKVVKIGGEIKETNIGSLKINNVGFSAIKKEFSLSDEKNGQKVLNINIEGDNFFENFEIPFVIGKNIEPFYEAEIPPKKKIILKPDSINLKKNGKMDILYITFGSSVERERFKIENILDDVNLKICEFYKEPWKDKGDINNFPVSYEEILSYDIIILQSSINCLGEIREEMIKDFVEAGGCLLIFGGYFSYGKSDVRKGSLSSILPFKITSPFDLKNSKERINFKESFPFKELFKDYSPYIFWFHKVEIDKGEILLEIEGEPLLIEKKYGKGKILCFTGTFLGNKEGKQIPLWEWQNYKEFIKKLVNYGTGGNI